MSENKNKTMKLVKKKKYVDWPEEVGTVLDKQV